MKSVALFTIALACLSSTALAQLTGPAGMNRFNGSSFGTNINGLGNAGGFATGGGLSNATTSSANFGSNVVGGFRYNGGLGNGGYPSGYTQNNFGQGGNVYGGNNSAGMSPGLTPGGLNAAGLNPAGVGGIDPTGGISSAYNNAYGAVANAYGYQAGGIGGYGGYGPYGGYGAGMVLPGLNGVVGDAFSVGALQYGGMPGFAPGYLGAGYLGAGYPGMLPGQMFPGQMAGQMLPGGINAVSVDGQTNATATTTRRPPVSPTVAGSSARTRDAADQSASDLLPESVQAAPISTANAIRIQNRLHNIKTVNLQGVRVMMAGRVAVLEGQVGSEADSQLTERMVALEPGVGSVTNKLQHP